MTQSIQETIEGARSALAQGDPSGSYRTLQAVFGRIPDQLEDRQLFCQAVGLLAQLSRAFGAGALAADLEYVQARPDDLDHLYESAYGLYEQGQHPPAVTLLTRANRLSPGSGAIVTELAGNLEQMMLYQEASRVLDQSGLAASEPFCAYLSGYTRIMCGQIEQARERLRWLQAQPKLEDPLPEMCAALAGILARADALGQAGIALGTHSLTAWQAAICGTILLHECEEGYEDAMRGRYCYLGDGPSLMRLGLERMALALPLIRSLPQVVAAPDRPSQILARAAAQMLQLPCVNWEPGRESSGLIVAWTLESIEDQGFLSAISTHSRGGRLFVHGCSWTQPFPFAPDFTTLLYQHITNPWSGGALRVDPETQKLAPASPDERPVEVLAEEILASPAESSRSSPELISQILSACGHLPEAQQLGCYRGHGRRLLQRRGGPVLSNHF